MQSLINLSKVTQVVNERAGSSNTSQTVTNRNVQGTGITKRETGTKNGQAEERNW